MTILKHVTQANNCKSKKQTKGNYRSLEATSSVLTRFLIIIRPEKTPLSNEIAFLNPQHFKAAIARSTCIHVHDIHADMFMNLIDAPEKLISGIHYLGVMGLCR